MEKAVVILPTYNGEKYLTELLDSIFDQTYENIEIITRDDGSKDNSAAVMKKYAEENNRSGRTIKIIENDGRNLGVPDCFIELLEAVPDGDYYFFADQDDFWIKDKIEKAIAKLKTAGDTPAIHFGAYNKCTSDLQYMDRSVPLSGEIGLRQVMYDYFPLGFNLSFNKPLYDFVFAHRPKRIISHDNWYAQVAAGCGKFLYSNEPSVLYRRQEGAVSYANHDKFAFFIWRVKRFFGNGRKKLTECKEIIAEYEDLFHDYLSEEDNEMLCVFTQDSFANYFRRIFYPKRLRLKMSDEIALRIIFLFRLL